MTESCDAVVVGAGLSGLTVARHLHRAGAHVIVCEAGDDVGGRVRTDEVDGMLLDRGFQLLNPAYPRSQSELDLPALRLRPFQAGAVVAHGSRRFVVADPVRSPRDAWSDLRMPLGTWRERIAFLRWAAQVGFGPADRIKRGPDTSLAQELRRRGLDGALTDGVLRPFLAGVLAEDEFATSRRFAELLVRSFVRGTPGVPSEGMRAIPRQLAAGLPDGTVRLHTQVRAVSPTQVRTDSGTITARVVIVAADPTTSASLTGSPAPRMRSLTTFYHRAPSSPATRTLLHLDAESRGPVVNTAVMTDAAPSYAPGRTLIASTLLGGDGSAQMQRRARDHTALIFGVDAADWEHVATYPVVGALPVTPPGAPLRRPVRIDDTLFVAGDHRDTASIQGAFVSGARAAAAAVHALGLSATPR